MFPKVNGKSFLELTEEDLEVLIDNPDFRENEYLDYKKNFAFLGIPKNKEDNIASKTAEFRNDVCAFANAQGGYLVYGISDKNGCAREVVGVDIQNGDTDHFELARRANLVLIRPRIPYLKFHFIKLQNEKYVVIIFVKHDNFAPYVHIEGDNDYRIFKRYGNGKHTMPYSELKNMFIQSVALDKEIYNYREDRIAYYYSKKESEDSIFAKFVLLHIIPETFVDPSYNKNMFILERECGKDFSKIFGNVGACINKYPCVDGLHIHPYGSRVQSECFINNNGVAECFLSLFDDFLSSNGNKQYIQYMNLWSIISGVIKNYSDVFKEIYPAENIYVGISLIGCKGIISGGDDWDNKIAIDRDLIVCTPVAVNCSDNSGMEIFLKKLKIEFLLSLGIKNDRVLNELLQEVYNV